LCENFFARNGVCRTTSRHSIQNMSWAEQRKKRLRNLRHGSILEGLASRLTAFSSVSTSTAMLGRDAASRCRLVTLIICLGCMHQLAQGQGTGWPDWSNFRLLGGGLLWSVLRITEAAQNFGLLLFRLPVRYVLISTKEWLGYVLGDFFKNSSGHTVKASQIIWAHVCLRVARFFIDPTYQNENESNNLW
jgi:hypothetical protein